MVKIVPRLSDFQVFPLSLISDGNLYLILFRDVQGNWCLDQWPSGCPNRMQPLYYHPTPVSGLDLSRRFWSEVKYQLPLGEFVLPEAVT